MNNKTLGKLEAVDLREHWKDEARDFTIWIANPIMSPMIECQLFYLRGTRTSGSIPMQNPNI